MAITRSLYLVRHAIAAERGDKYPDDAERPLTHEGAAKMREVVKGLAAQGAEISLILTSPLLRTRETADLLARGFDPRPPLVTVAALAPGGAPARVAEEVGRHTKARSIALVGHEPGIGELAAWLTGGRTPFVFKKGGICRIDFADWPPARQGQLLWLATPKMIRALR
jgi:phosphohistidine phosphatase